MGAPDETAMVPLPASTLAREVDDMASLFPPILLALALVAGQALAGNQDDPHATHHPASHHGSPAHDSPVRPPEGGWKPDAPLREGMRRMRDAIQALAPHEDAPMAEAAVSARVAEIDQAAAYMFANCRLEPEPDHALHDVLARLMAGAQALRSDPADPSPVASMRAALHDYVGLFDDPTLLSSAQPGPQADPRRHPERGE